ncbi:protein-tyrosine-phosphatase [Tenacibaculum sp. IB213877]|uniref:arsenate-mycothiol transferase ArsC n=1 Tax=Tenacibaculum sp. IB213877 TaxID=3097351 RepID=UPI002A59D0BB|nr:protein-tyrosine-phosphatase [Tenacibaculum sp. IB213877]MDY0781144.1 protein-tyrosine-phosphatase [Tenacibaculum sp. IB213877]
MNTQLTTTILNINTEQISSERKEVLNSFTDYLQRKLDKKEHININFICTHNSRRSHLGQIWMQTLASYFNMNTITCYSGGTEATAMAKPIVKTLEKQGFEINSISEGNNPVYAIKFDDNSHPVICFSKEFSHSFNPKSNFIAVMTCSQADEGCPFVSGCEKRFSIMYEDPKLFDNSPLQEEKYLERSNQIATEIYYVLNQLKS